MSSGGNPPDCTQTEIDTFSLNRQLEIHETEDDIAHDDVIIYGYEEDGNEDNDDWMEGAISNHLAEQDFDDAS